MLSDNTCAIIEEIKVENLSKPEITYNFEVEDYHTYYVTDSKILVHNKCWEWGKGSFDTSEQSLSYHANKHAGKLGIDPSDTAKYFKKASDFADTVVQRGVKAGKYVEGFTSNVRAYTYMGKTIWLDKANGIIVNFFVP